MTQADDIRELKSEMDDLDKKVGDLRTAVDTHAARSEERHAAVLGELQALRAERRWAWALIALAMILIVGLAGVRVGADVPSIGHLGVGEQPEARTTSSVEP